MTAKYKISCSVALALGTTMLTVGAPAPAQASGAEATGQTEPATPTALSVADVSALQGTDTSNGKGIRLAQAGSAANPGAPSAGAEANSLPSSPVRLSDVVVTAEKRSEELLSVPVPVTALDASDLLANNQLRIQDYFSEVPGLQFSTDGDFGTPQIAIRGIIAATGATPTVGVTVDGVPFGSSTSAGAGSFVPDIDPSELARVEVLRGPQGTLYGADSMGGLLQYVTIDPSTDELTGRVQAGVSEVQNGAEPGYNVRGALNIPLSDTFAVRASAFTRQDPGYINDPAHNKTGVNEVDVDGGHLAALWRPSDDFSAKFSAFYQHDELFGSPYADITSGLADLQQDRVPESGAGDKTLQGYSLTLDQKLGTFDLTSISSYSENKVTQAFDASSIVGAVNALVGFPGTSDIAGTLFNTNKWTQEVRLSTPIVSHVDWLFGLFYTHESSEGVQNIFAADGATGAPVSSAIVGFLPLELGFTPSMFQEYAAFTDFTFKITNRFDIQVGGRESHDNQSFGDVVSGALVAPPVNLQLGSKDNAFTYLVTPRWRVFTEGTDRVMLYARLASGFRPGGANAVGAVAGVPRTYNPDKTENYDLGLKADLLDRTLFLDASLFYIDWKDIQTNELIADQDVLINGSQAKSQGAELSIEWRPKALPGLTLGANSSWDDAVLTKALPPTAVTFAPNGAMLPFTAKYTGNLTADQEFPLGDLLRGFVGAQLSYLGQRYSTFAASATAGRQVFPAFAQTNLRAGFRWTTFTADVYATNVTNRRGELAGGIGLNPPTEFDFITPRTVGIEFSEVF